MKTTKQYRDKIMTCLLTPFSWMYGAGVYIRNKLFDKHILPQEEFKIPVVTVGNLTIGGTGKTPHVEFLVTHLASEYNVAILSRGYKRKTRGYVLANPKSTPETIGDEPYQIYQKFGRVAKIAVCENRREGINKIMDEFPEVNLIILDDGFQHRWVKPKVSLLVTDFNRPFYQDKLLPLGRLRESEHGATRADFVIVSKCPTELQPIDFRLIVKKLQLSKYQKPFFSYYGYRELTPVFPDEAKYRVSLDSLTDEDSVVLLTGIAHPRYFVRHFKPYPFRKKVFHFPDHHQFKRNDIAKIADEYEKLPGRHKIIITTEKDAVRLAHNPYFPKHLKPFIFYIPIEVRMLEGLDGSDFITALKKSIEEKENPLNVKYNS